MKVQDLGGKEFNIKRREWNFQDDNKGSFRKIIVIGLE